ncbi:DNA-3-methyladenine glycosylase I [Leuconostoc citreum]|uniref:DNA-3-methyladenine glycosylase I n=1 Tax=Leuconostoc citreum TaxID=33964 RepID=UPI000246644C|nr:DNA-3-methyladenine glycosylase I [Leuconostoc citreum]MCS8587697.1 DNA-3-methyladenine glycosylase I [Leuconostoc citreum]MCS8594520.1 DNA-3-methyladenine glycosylase I [Leuconostoc citreum]MCS8599283.1 DNA-3-methyladenine glycosylase I [Leuconostoc citreum]CCF23771.1 3-methyladenine DNA glycosylase [Leuconostoc citreum LBAE C10]CDX65395.1 3-methyladenine DNA glycosylase [Leuconostoc citreum]
MANTTKIARCAWASGSKTTPLMMTYHDLEWGHPLKDNDSLLFELLTLEIFQAGLSWEIVLKKRHHLKKAFWSFDLESVAKMGDDDVYRLCQNADIIRNKQKILATIHNAKVIQQIQTSYGSFSNYIWHFTENQVIDHNIQIPAEVPSKDALSEYISKAMKKIGFKFTGPVVIYAYLQSIGIINDHESNCTFKYHN